MLHRGRATGRVNGGVNSTGFCELLEVVVDGELSACYG